MKFALINSDGIIENIIITDNESKQAALAQYEIDKKAFDNAMIEYREALVKYDEEMREAIAELAASKLNDDKQGISDAKKTIKGLRTPARPKRLKTPQGLYQPPEGYTMKSLQAGQTIGDKYNA